jgi:hypothetical protein
MTQPTESFKQFDYALRPSKQIERKTMIEVLLRISKAGYNIQEYAYMGFGSVYYVDFVMFHKYLFISQMTCVEWGRIARRMRFNKPYKFIKLKLGALSKHIPSIRPSQRLLMWLDYDRALDQSMLQDIDGCLERLGRRSIFIITIDARAKLPKDEFDLEDLSAEDQDAEIVRAYQRWFGSYADGKITRDRISGADVAPLFYEVVRERIRQTLTRKEPELRFIQIFHFFYRDGAPMLTLGGIIGTQDDEENLRHARIFELPLVRTGKERLGISVPPLTLRERQWLDRRVSAKLRPDKISFELDEDLLQNYCAFYKEYPTYLETLL